MLVNEPGDRTAESDAVALKIDLSGDLDFEHGDIAIVREGNPGNLKRGAGLEF